MVSRNTQNEGIGITSIIVIVIIAVIGLYFFFSRHTVNKPHDKENYQNVPLEVPAPNVEHPKK